METLIEIQYWIHGSCGQCSDQTKQTKVGVSVVCQGVLVNEATDY